MGFVVVNDLSNNKVITFSKSNFSNSSNCSAFITLKNIFKSNSSKGSILDISKVNDEQKEMILNFAARYLYKFDKYKSNKKANGDVRVYLGGITKGYMKVCLDIHKYIEYSKDIINEPANIATPEYICKKVQRDFRGVKGIKLKILNEIGISKEGLNLVNAVGSGSTRKPRFLVIEYKSHDSKAKTICLCGKGVTFDAGGTQIKTGSKNSYVMKGDKTGGCIVIGMVKYFAESGFGCNIIGIVPLVENVVSGSAIMPGDIIKSHSGKTVEVLNTDAEGRLILADALSYSGNYKPDYVFDFATLTGWASKLHCDTSAIFFSCNQRLHRLVEEIGEKIGERTWGMPKWLDYMRYCKSEVADLKNYDLNVDGCSSGGGYMATMFLAHFVPKQCLKNWVHFDICNNIDGHIMNANTMNLAINLIKRIINTNK